MASSIRPKQGPSRGKSLIGAMLIASAIALVLIVYIRQADRSPSPTQSQPVSRQTTGSSSSKRAENPPAQPQQQASEPQTPQSQQQTSPQGGTGPLETGSGGAPAASPQGETPPGMQSAPAGSSAKDPKSD
jgi:predicted lipid-binding transport protein (Tim44 family)